MGHLLDCWPARVSPDVLIPPLLSATASPPQAGDHRASLWVAGPVTGDPGSHPRPCMFLAVWAVKEDGPAEVLPRVP